jgi:hypothetical protein
MLAETLAALAATGATTLVAAMTTDAWQAARSGVARLFGRDGLARQEAIEAQLAGNAALVAQADDAGRVRQSLVALWQLELESLLRQHPDAAEELGALVAHVQAALPPAQQEWVQTNIARDHGKVFAVQGGNIVFHSASPRPAAPAADDDIDDSQ